MLGTIQPKLGMQKAPNTQTPKATVAAAQAEAPVPADVLSTSAPADDLPSLEAIRQRAQAAASDTPDQAVEAHKATGMSTGKKAAMIGLTAVTALTALSGTAQAADLDITIGPGGIGVHIGKGHHRHRRGGHHGGHHNGGYICEAPNNTDGPYWRGVGLDGQMHRFDRHNEVNDHTGHYSFITDFYGNVTGVNCNTQQDGYWGY